MEDAKVFRAHASHVPALLFTPDSRVLISAGMDNVVKLWSVPGWDLIGMLKGHAKSVNTLSLSPDGGTLATGSSDRSVKLWSFPYGTLRHSLQDRKRVVATVRISPDGKWVAAGSYGGRAMVWTLAAEPVVGISVSKKNLACIAFSPNATKLATAGHGDDISVWSLPSGEQIATLSGHQTAVMSLAFAGGGRQIVSLGYEQSVRFWDAERWEAARVLPVPGGTARGLALSPDESTAALSLDGKVQLWSVEQWSLDAELPVSVKAVYGTTFSPNGRWLAAGAADGKIRVWDLKD